MNRKNILYLILAFTTLICGCAKDIYNGTSGDDSEDGMVRVEVQSSVSISSEVSTRAVNESGVGGIAVAMIFDSQTVSTALLKQAPVVIEADGGRRFMTVFKEKTNSYVLIVQNITEANKTYLLSLQKGAKLSEISRLLTMDTSSKGFTTSIPMSGWSALIPKMDKVTTARIGITLVRGVARIDINSGTANFKIHSVKVSNAPRRGYIIPQLMLPFAGLNDVVAYDEVKFTTPTTTVSKAIYCFEDRGMQGNTNYPTRLVIYGVRNGAITPSYYGVNIVYPATQGSTSMAYHMTRNKVYTINLNKVEVDGYSTYEEAVKADPFNTIIDNDIIVSDPYSHDIISNGQQFLGATNAEFVVYPAEEGKGETNMNAATISYTSAANWGLGKVEASEGITLLEGVERLEIQEGSVPIYRDITIKKLADNFTSGTITITVGNLQKVINVRTNLYTLPIGQVSNNYFAAPSTKGDYKIGEIINPSTETSWLKLSTTEKYEGSSSLNDRVETTGTDGIYIHIQPYIAESVNVASREGYLYITGEKKDQRIRVLVRQKGYDIKAVDGQITPYTYVATFHRWNQTAERIINMPSADTDWWHAEVMVGDDFIKLSTTKSSDTGIGTAPIYATDDAIEANCQLTDGQKTISVISGAANNIYFRVGLTSKLSNEQATPRYGMITVTFGNGTTTKGIHNIFVRQGEAADYVMRPTDKTNSTDWSSNIRPKAVKFSPYNLTDIITPTADVVERGAGSYNFVNYPSQGGYYFLASGTQAINPTVTSTATALKTPPTFVVGTNWDLSWEVCPKGYRRPQDGLGRAFSLTTATDDIENSEVRQSLWYKPTSGAGAGTAETVNQLFGYIADGYFDRRKIEPLTTAMTNITNGIVSKGTVDAAYCGILTYNPNTYASIFTPFCGMYDPLSGSTKQGNQSSFQVSTPGTALSGWLVSYGLYSGDYSIFINERTALLQGYSVRCIKDEKPPLNTDDSQVEIPGKGEDTQIISMLYTGASTLQLQIEAAYTKDIRKRINTISIGTTGTYFTEADYKYLNDWADKSDHRLTNIILRGPGTEDVPAGAFTSSKWKSINLSSAKTFRTGAFTATLTGLYELIFNYMDTMTTYADAFAFDTEKVYLYLGPEEYAKGVVSKQWGTKTVGEGETPLSKWKHVFESK